MISKLTKSALIAVLTLTVFVALPQLMCAQEAVTQAPVGRLNITWNINLSGPAFLGAVPVGAAEYEVEGRRRRFSAEADNLNLPNGSRLAVYVAGKLVGTFTLTDGGGVCCSIRLPIRKFRPYSGEPRWRFTTVTPRSCPANSDGKHEPV